jgi:hypothetical protein
MGKRVGRRFEAMEDRGWEESNEKGGRLRIYFKIYLVLAGNYYFLIKTAYSDLDKLYIIDQILHT